MNKLSSITSSLTDRKVESFIGLGWGIFLLLVIMTFYFQRVYFDFSIVNTMDYLLVGAIWLGFTVLGTIVSKKLSINVLSILIMIVAGLAGIIWLFYALDLPADLPPARNCYTWDCEFLMSFLRRGSSWPSQTPGVVLLLVLTFALFPVFWFQWAMRQNQLRREAGSSDSNSFRIELIGLGCAGCAFIVVGFLGLFAYYLASFLTAWLWLLLAFIPWLANRSNRSLGLERIVDNPHAPVRANALHVFQDIGFIVMLGVFVFAIGDRNLIPVEIFWQIGSGLFITLLFSGVVSHFLGKNRWDMTIRLIEFFVFGTLMSAMIMGLYLFEENIEIRANHGVAPFLIGILVSYLLLRWIGFTSGQKRVLQSSFTGTSRLEDPGTSLFVNNVLILFIFIIGLINITLIRELATWLYGIGFILTIVEIVGSVIEYHAQKHNSILLS